MTAAAVPGASAGGEDPAGTTALSGSVAAPPATPRSWMRTAKPSICEFLKPGSAVGERSCSAHRRPTSPGASIGSRHTGREARAVAKIRDRRATWSSTVARVEALIDSVEHNQYTV